MAIIEVLKASLEQEESNVVDFEVEKLSRERHADPRNMMPDKCLALALADCKQFGDVIGCYVTLIREDAGEALTVESYRAGLNRAEEIAYRQLGLNEAIENWKD